MNPRQDTVTMERLYTVNNGHTKLHFSSAVEAGFYLSARKLDADISSTPAVKINAKFYALSEINGENYYYNIDDDLKKLQREAIHSAYIKKYEAESHTYHDEPYTYTAHTLGLKQASGGLNIHFPIYIDKSGQLYKIKPEVLQVTSDPEFAKVKEPVNALITSLVFKKTEAKNYNLRLLEQIRADKAELAKQAKLLEDQEKMIGADLAQLNKP